MKTENHNGVFNHVKYAFPKKPTYYFHADDDFREDKEWGKEKTNKVNTTNASLASATSLVAV
jgi:hypothetical protein